MVVEVGRWLQNVCLSITDSGQCLSGERRLRMRGGWLRGGEPRGRGCATCAISEIRCLQDPGYPTLGATPLPAGGLLGTGLGWKRHGCQEHQHSPWAGGVTAPSVFGDGKSPLGRTGVQGLTSLFVKHLEPGRDSARKE